MPVVVQVCIVVATLGFVALCIATLRAIGRFEKTADRIAETADAVTVALGDVRKIADEAHEVVSLVGDVATRFRGTAEGFNRLGDRALRLSNAVMDEVAAPVGKAAAVMRGVRYGLDRIVSRLTGGVRSTPTVQGGQ